ncbi:MAG: TauD/TfdA family dioxygenase [Pseudomonadota bacterium]
MPIENAYEVRPIAGSIGAEIRGVDLTNPLNPGQFEFINQAFLDHMVIFLPQQSALTPQHLTDFARHFGQLDSDPFVFPFKIPPVKGYPEIYSNIKEADNTGINIGGYWHADVTYREKPHKASVIYAKEVPDFGGDTMFANQYLAYETLPEEMKARLSGMQAVHSSAMPHGQAASRFASISRHHAPAPEDKELDAGGQEVVNVDVIENIHPVVRIHPDTGKKHLYVNRGFTSHFVGMTESESLPLLEALWAHASRAELTCRYRWQQNAVAVWDNRATLHYAINDYFGERRHMQRVSIHED